MNKVKWGRHTYVGSINVCGGWQDCVQIGSFCSIATNVTFNLHPQHDYKKVSTFPFRTKILNQGEVDSFYKGGITIGHDVWIGDYVTVLDGIKIGNGAVIGDYAVVTKSVEPYSIVGGNPIKIIKYRFSPEQIQSLLKISWWDWSDELIKERVLDFDDVDNFIKKHSGQ